MSSRRSTSEPPLGGAATPARPVGQLDALCGGDRDTFVRYYELHRAPVYGLVSWFLGPDEAVCATREVFTRAYRRILLGDDDRSPSAVTYAAALEVCHERRDGDESPCETPAVPASSEPPARQDAGVLVEDALVALSFEQQAVLWLHDQVGLDAAALAPVLGLTENEAAALLFRAREEFRRTFNDLSLDVRGSSCRLAEETAAGAVGRRLSDYETRRLHEHAEYCRHCRRVMKGWGAGVVGLALFVSVATPPPAMATAPVFGTLSPLAGPLRAAAARTLLTRILAPAWRTATSRAAAYAVAAACLALSAGLAVQLAQRQQNAAPPLATAPSSAPSPSAPSPSASGSPVQRQLVASGRPVTRRPQAEPSSAGTGEGGAPRTVALAPGGSPAGAVHGSSDGQAEPGGDPAASQPGADPATDGSPTPTWNPTPSWAFAGAGSGGGDGVVVIAALTQSGSGHGSGCAATKAYHLAARQAAKEAASSGQGTGSKAGGTKHGSKTKHAGKGSGDKAKHPHAGTPGKAGSGGKKDGGGGKGHQKAAKSKAKPKHVKSAKHGKGSGRSKGTTHGKSTGGGKSRQDAERG